MKDRFMSVVCADVLLTRNNDKEFLLMKRINTGSNDGMYELPGGHLEKDEDIFGAMIREIKEELLLDIKETDLELIHFMHHYNVNRLNFIFKCDGSNLNPQIGEPNKCEDLVWVDFDSIPDNTTDKVKIILDNIRNSKFYDKL